uniref:SCP domain-containing protein n=1 Tax=Trichuris muris TaxID=70415 RepID=A0A5S6QS31_TRIMR
MVHVAQLQRTPLSFNDEMAVEMLFAINVLRSQREVALMECIRYWNRDIATFAQAVADNCSGQAPSSPKYAVSIALLPADATLAVATMVQGFQLIPDSYNVALNSCEQGVNRPVSQHTCRSIRQFYWFQGNETGCGFTRCPSIANADPAFNIHDGYILACAFSVSAAQQFRPYPPRSLPHSVPCLTCLSSKDRCDPTTLHLCCDAVVGNLKIVGVGDEGAKKLECGQQPENLTNVFRFYNNVLRTNILSFDSIPNSFPADVNSHEGKYTILGPVGSVVPLGYTAGGCPFLEPIVHLYSNVLRQNLYLISKLEIEIRIQEGHINNGVVGYAVSGYAMCNATIAMYRFYNRFINAVQLSNYTDARLVFNGIPPGYESEGISFYLWEPVEGTK